MTRHFAISFSLLTLLFLLGCGGGTVVDEGSAVDETGTVTEEVDSEDDESETSEETDTTSDDDDTDPTETNESQSGCSDTSQEEEPYVSVVCVESLAESCSLGGAGIWNDFGQAYLTVIGQVDDESPCGFELLVESEGDARGYICTFDSALGFPSEAMTDEDWVFGSGPDDYACTLIENCNIAMDSSCLSEWNSCQGAG